MTVSRPNGEHRPIGAGARELACTPESGVEPVVEAHAHGPARALGGAAYLEKRLQPVRARLLDQHVAALRERSERCAGELIVWYGDDHQVDSRCSNRFVGGVDDPRSSDDRGGEVTRALGDRVVQGDELDGIRKGSRPLAPDEPAPHERSPHLHPRPTPSWSTSEYSESSMRRRFRSEDPERRAR